MPMGTIYFTRLFIIYSVYTVQECYSCIKAYMLYQNDCLLIGEKLKEMRVDELLDKYYYISIKGDELAVAGWYTKSLLLFKIVY